MSFLLSALLSVGFLVVGGFFFVPVPLPFGISLPCLLLPPSPPTPPQLGSSAAYEAEMVIASEMYEPFFLAK